MFVNALESDNVAVRRQLYAGRLYLLPANQASCGLLAAVQAELQAELGFTGPIREAQFRFSDEDFFERVGRLRKRFYTSREYHLLVAAVLQSVGFGDDLQVFDPLRLRVVMHGGESHPFARAVYYGHRDTWYANSQSMISWWIPLHDVAAEETFEFFPDEFSRPVANDSEEFDFDRWTADGQQNRIGWQARETGRTETYPRLLEAPRGGVVPVACRAGEILLFSAQHLHRTRANRTGRTRFSVDFRTVHLDDDRLGRGAANVDNRSTGNSAKQFVLVRDLLDRGGDA